VTRERRRLKKTSGKFKGKRKDITIHVMRVEDYQTGCKLLKSLHFPLIMVIIKLDIKGRENIKLNTCSSPLANQLDNGNYQGQVSVIIKKYGQFDSVLLVYRKSDNDYGQNNRKSV
jgi:hypothetical protein